MIVFLFLACAPIPETPARCEATTPFITVCRAEYPDAVCYVSTKGGISCFPKPTEDDRR